MRKFFFYLFNDPYWIFEPLLRILYKIFTENSLKKTFYKNQLDKLIKTNKYKKDTDFDIYGPITEKNNQYEPEILDLARLYKLVKKKKPMTILEFGVGYSTLVMAQAIYENKKKLKNNSKIGKIRNTKKFKLYCVDTSKKWINNTKKSLPSHLKDIVNFSVSPVDTITHNSEVCHTYKFIPDVNPDFIYLDGPHPTDPKGKINNVSFKCIERTPISADVCLLESTLIPGSSIFVDGRTNNVRFLKRNLKRKYKFKWDRVGDTTLITLNEKFLGKLNKNSSYINF
tara:strand:+ start:11072 stop:11923 length:852 start_codon:yes stop_codon:yes gene_type:complete